MIRSDNRKSPNRIARFSTIVSVLCALALSLSAFAHHPVASEKPHPNIDLSAYALPDGSLPVLCSSASDDGNGNSASIHCEFCRLASAATLPESSAPPHVRFARLPFSHAVLEEIEMDRSMLAVHAPPQGPPFNAA